MSGNAKYKALRGMPDMVPEEAFLMRSIEEAIRRVFSSCAFKEIRTPILEETEVFTRSIGEDTDIVEKEMYSFQDRGGKSVSMRPEGTASILRAYIEHGWFNDTDIVKLFYCGPMFRGERPQKGRLRQFHQAGVEIIGGSNPYIDAELIASLDNLFSALGVKDYTIQLNSLGCASDREKFKKVLADFLRTRTSDLCENCLRRIGTNVLRVLDCKQEGCKDVVKDSPRVKDSLCPPCLDSYKAVKNILKNNKVHFIEKNDLVRGLDYYTGTVFEVMSSSLGAQDAIAAGGRYDGLCEEMGGPKTGATGYAVGLERLILAVDTEKYKEKSMNGIFVAVMDSRFAGEGFSLVNELRKRSITSDWDQAARSFKAQMRKADRQKWEYVIILGEDEVKSGRLAIKNMVTGTQEKMTFEEICKKWQNTMKG